MISLSDREPPSPYHSFLFSPQKKSKVETTLSNFFQKTFISEWTNLSDYVTLLLQGEQK